MSDDKEAVAVVNPVVEEGTRWQKEDYEFKTKNHGTQTVVVEFREFANIEAARAFVGGESGELELINSVVKNRTKSAASASARNLPAEGDIKNALETGTETGRKYAYGERGVSDKAKVQEMRSMDKQLADAIASGDTNVMQELLAKLRETLNK